MTTTARLTPEQLTTLFTLGINPHETPVAQYRDGSCHLVTAEQEIIAIQPDGSARRIALNEENRVTESCLEIIDETAHYWKEVQ